MMRAVPDDDLGAVERPLYLTAAMTGLRQGELLGLRWCDVDWIAGARARRRELHARRVRLAEVAPRALASRWPTASPASSSATSSAPRSRGDDDLVFAHPQTGHVLDASKLRKRFRARASPAPGVRDLTFHELRHTFGTQMAAAGAPLRAIQEWMGHADASTTEIYAHYAPGPGGRGGVRRAGVRRRPARSRAAPRCCRSALARLERDTRSRPARTTLTPHDAAGAGFRSPAQDRPSDDLGVAR